MMTSTMPNRVYLRIAGGGVTMPSGKPYTTVVGDDRPQERYVEYIRADLASRLIEALEFIRDGYGNQDVNHVDYRVKVYEVALDALGGQEQI
jgi:hypothetical protein